jgi:hypothetical protein
VAGSCEQGNETSHSIKGRVGATSSLAELLSASQEFCSIELVQI